MYLFLNRGRGGRNRGEKHRLAASHTWPNWGVGPQSGHVPDWESNQQPFTLQDSTQPAEHWSGPLHHILKTINNIHF